MSDDPEKPEEERPVQQVPGIHAAMLRVMGDIGFLAKDKKNTQQKFMFRGIDAVMTALQPAFIKHGVFLVPEVLEHRDVEIESGKGTHGWRVCLRMRFTFYALDGSSVVAVTDGEAIDYADKATNKAMSVALKYAVLQSFMVPTEETGSDDTEATSPDGRARDIPIRRGGKQTYPERDYPSDDPLDRVGAEPATESQRRAIYAMTEKLGMKDRDRALILKNYDVLYTKELSKANAAEILKMLTEQEKAHGANDPV